MNNILPQKEKKKFVVVTENFSGLGFAKMIIDSGYTAIMACQPEEEKDLEELAEKDLDEMEKAHKQKELEEALEKFWKVGEGIVPRVHLKELLKEKDKFKDYYFLWDGNHNWEVADQLREEGFKVFGGQELTFKMEKDRQFGTEIIKKAGLQTPPTYEFSTIEEGLKFLDENLDKAFVFKPDDSGKGCFTTYVPDSVKKEAANRELYAYLASQDPEVGTYILQERKDGVETNFEVWIYKGRPFFAWCELECKRKLNQEEGEMVGCGQSLGFIVSLDCKGVEMTVGKLLPYFRNYTGFIDMNVIVSDKELYFIEFCARFGYNAHPNLFLNLAQKPFCEIISDFVDGKTENFYDNFKYGFGATVSLYIDHPIKGYPIYIDPEIEDKFYHFDTFKEKEDEANEYSLAGYGNEVGIVCAHGYDMKSTAEQCIKNTEKITYPNHACRTDLDKDTYENSPLKRYTALEAMKML